MGTARKVKVHKVSARDKYRTLCGLVLANISPETKVVAAGVPSSKLTGVHAVTCRVCVQHQGAEDRSLASDAAPSDNPGEVARKTLKGKGFCHECGEPETLYAKGLEHYALNDNPGERELEVIQQSTSVALLADMFGLSVARVALDVLKVRELAK